MSLLLSSGCERERYFYFFSCIGARLFMPTFRLSRVSNEGWGIKATPPFQNSAWITLAEVNSQIQVFTDIIHASRSQTAEFAINLRWL